MRQIFKINNHLYIYPTNYNYYLRKTCSLNKRKETILNIKLISLKCRYQFFRALVAVRKIPHVASHGEPTLVRAVANSEILTLAAKKRRSYCGKSREIFFRKSLVSDSFRVLQQWAACGVQIKPRIRIDCFNARSPPSIAKSRIIIIWPRRERASSRGAPEKRSPRPYWISVKC